MPATRKLPEYQDVVPSDVAWWICMSVMQTGCAPMAAQIRERFGMSVATSYRWQRWAKDKYAQMQARRGEHNAQ